MLKRPALLFAPVVLWIVLYGLQLYPALTFPFLPFYLDQSYHATVGQVLDASSSGGLQPGDEILSLDGRPMPGCQYLFHTPLYPVSATVDVAYRNAASPPGLPAQMTQIALLPPSRFDAFTYIIPALLASAAFVVTGSLILLNGHAETAVRLLLGNTLVLGGFIILDVSTLSALRTPTAFMYPLGLPVWNILALVTHSRWPTNQTRSRLFKTLLILSGTAAAASIALQIKANPVFGCLSPTLDSLDLYLWAAIGFLSLVNVLAPLAAAYRALQTPFEKSQTRTLLWAVGIGLGIPVLFSMLPSLFGPEVPIEPGYMLVITAIIPLTYTYVAYQSRLIQVERYLIHNLFTVIFLTTWLLTTALLLWLLERWLPDPGTLLIAIATSVPALLFSTALHGPLWKLAELALYRRTYDYDSLLLHLTRQLSAAPSTGKIVEGLTQDLPTQLTIQYAALWLYSPATQTYALLKTGGLQPAQARSLPDPFDPAQLDSTPHSKVDHVITYHQVNILGGVPWYAAAGLASQEALEAILLLGPKTGNIPYSEKDIRVISSITGWAAAHLSARRLSDERVAQETQLTALLLAHEEELRRKTAAELHDRGITNLGLVKRMVEKNQSPPVILAAVQRITDELRDVLEEQLNPFAVQHSLIDALRYYVIERLPGSHSVTLHAPQEDIPAWDRLDTDTKYALFYATREALENALRADDAAPIQVTLLITPATYRVTIEDQGPGFDLSKLNLTQRRHRGLALMHARLQRIGGQVTIESHIGVGTTVHLDRPRDGNGQ